MTKENNNRKSEAKPVKMETLEIRRMFGGGNGPDGGMSNLGSAPWTPPPTPIKVGLGSGSNWLG